MLPESFLFAALSSTFFTNKILEFQLIYKIPNLLTTPMNQNT